MEKFKTIINNAEAEIVERRSKFIANIYYVKSLEEVEEKLKAIKRNILILDIIVMHIELKMRIPL